MKKEEITRIKSYIIERFRKQMEDTDLSIRTLMEKPTMYTVGDWTRMILHLKVRQEICR